MSELSKTTEVPNSVLTCEETNLRGSCSPVLEKNSGDGQSSCDRQPLSFSPNLRCQRGRSKTGPASCCNLLSDFAFGKQFRHNQLFRFKFITHSGGSSGLSFEPSNEQMFGDLFNRKRSNLEREHHQWITVFKRMFSDLAEQSDRKRQTIDKETFLEYFPLPGVLGERLFDLFDTDGSHSIDFYEFFRGLCIIYNGSLEEKKKFLFNMYDLDNNGRISRAEFSALLSHIPVAFKVLHHLAHLDVTLMPQEFNWTEEKLVLEKQHPTLERNVNFLVHSIFSDASSTEGGNDSMESFQLTYDPEKLELTFPEFCAALERSKEISDVLELFYDDAMPDLPIPVEIFTESFLKNSQGLFSCLGVDGCYSKSNKWILVKIPSLFSLRKSKGFCVNGGISNRKKRLCHPFSQQDSESAITLMSQGKNGRSSYQYFDQNPALSVVDQQLDSSNTLSGWLYKIGRTFHMKCYRFYVLRDQFLYYFTAKKRVTPRNVMFIRGARISSACVTNEKDSSFAFDIELSYNRGRIRRIFAKDRHERDLWVRELSRVACTGRFYEEYVLQTFLARGRFAIVYKGVQKRTQLPVAIKIISKVSHNEPQQKKAFWRTEICALWLTQQHPNIVRLIDVHESSEHVYAVIEWIPRGDLASFLRRLSSHENHPCFCCFSSRSSSETRLVTTEMLAEMIAQIVARGVLNGLVCLHRYNIVHRDLKPENILLVTREDVSTLHNNKQDCMTCESTSIICSSICPCRNCPLCGFVRSLITVKLADFGLSAILNPQGYAREPLGTLCYAAPEIVRANPYGKPVDIWALGVLTYQVLSAYRQLPFDITSERQLTDSIISGHFAFEPAAHWDKVSPVSKDFVRHLLRLSPSLRPTAIEALHHPWLDNLASTPPFR